jgi:hypothetical protein
MAVPRTPLVYFHSLSLALALAFAVSGCGAAIPAFSGMAYYTDCARVDDANPGTSASQAWRTLDKVNATTFAPGDGILFLRGTTCPGSLRPQGSGEDGQPIIIGADGQGPHPLIVGKQLGWDC